MITGLAHICFTVRDLEKAEAFYEGTLGFKHAFDFRNDKGEKFGVYLHVRGRTFIELFKGASGGPREGQSYQHCCLEVDDIRRTLADLRAKGVQVSDPVLGSDQSWQAWLADPDGNRIELHHYTPASWQAPHLK